MYSTVPRLLSKGTENAQPDLGFRIKKRKQIASFCLSFAACVHSVMVCLLFLLVLMVGSTKIYLYNFNPLKPHFYIVKLGFIEVYIIFLISAQKT